MRHRAARIASLLVALARPDLALAQAETAPATPASEPVSEAVPADAVVAPEVSEPDTSVPSDVPPEVNAVAETVPEAVPEPPPAPTQLGPAEITFRGGRLSLGFVTQLRASVVNEGGGLGDDERETDGSIELRRVRLLLRGSFLDDRIGLFVQLSTSPSSLELLDVVVDGRLAPHAALRVGVFKTPFTLHRNRSYQNLSLTEWDPASVRFGAERQIGVEAHSIPTNDAGYIDYAIGVFTGVNSRAAFARGIAEVYAEPMPNPSNLRAPQPPTDVHPEIIGRVGYATAGATPLTMSDTAGGDVRAYGGLSFAYDAQPLEYRDFAMRIAAEGIVKVEHLMVNAVSYVGFFAPGGDGVRTGMLGADLDVAYRVHPRVEIAVRYARVDTLARLRDAARARADRLIAEAEDPAEVASQHALAGQLRNTEEYAVGLNVPIIGRSLIFQTDAALVRTDYLGTADEDAIRVRAQVQFGF